MNHTPLVMIRTFRDRAAADVACRTLTSARVPAVVEGPDERAASIWVTGYRLLIRPEDARRAARDGASDRAEDRSPMDEPSNRQSDGSADERNGWKNKREGERQQRHGVFSLYRNQLTS